MLRVGRAPSYEYLIFLIMVLTFAPLFMVTIDSMMKSIIQIKSMASKRVQVMLEVLKNILPGADGIIHSH